MEGVENIRAELVSELKMDLMGPRTEKEELNDRPVGWYICGILFPKNTTFTPEDQDVLDAGESDSEESEETDNLAIQSSSFKQNSIGISCQIKDNVKEIVIDVEYARYKSSYDDNTRKRKWIRNYVNISKQIELENNSTSNFFTINDEAEILWTLNEEENYRVLTVFLYNIQDPEAEKNQKDTSPGKEKEEIDILNELCLFQPQIKITSTTDSPIFDDKGLDLYPDVSDEDSSLYLLYRSKFVYAKGFNCAATWGPSNTDPLYVKTDIMPMNKAKGIAWSSNSNPGLLKDIDMKDLAYSSDPAEITKLLTSIPDEYEKWISKLERNLSSLHNTNLLHIAEGNIARCKNALRRIKEGISLVQQREEVFEAFVFANRAMLYQRGHYSYALSRFRGGTVNETGSRPEPRTGSKYFWRPFQLAFILLNLRGIVDPQSEDRKTADLLWFPTGGGKTESYLGLSAFTLALRRINGRSTASKGNGVSVIMRYTLRLLTIQQFQRATGLICACEKIRRESPKLWGEEPFLIGLWVGSNSTPNSFDEAADALMKLSNRSSIADKNPIQLSFCPWCGQKIDHNNFFADKNRRWIIVHCNNKSCDFYSEQRWDIKKALPVLTVDEDIYRRCPSVLIGTVDKFARMPWRSQTASIFGYVTRRCEEHGYFISSDNHPSFHHDYGKKIRVEQIENLPGPDLIIQDELHLISGPLGTIVGLYETAVEYLSIRQKGGNVFRPKIIVSTATVRGVEQQVKKLFNRKITETFPPSGTDADDTFFWREVEEGGRIFLGIAAPSISMKTAVLRIYASLLQEVQKLKESGQAIKEIDPYWTVVGYFDSKRELGGTIRLLEDDVVRRIDDIVNLIDTHRNYQKREIKEEELTSRKGSSEVSSILAALENTVNSPDSIDVLLATNMISVGMDVDRLGLMVVNGQPKNSAEYIQAVGRIGRKPTAPGLVITLYNAFRPRDLSHYENFIGYHSMLQRFVEHVSLTPFSERALDRALHAVFIAMIRLKIANFSARKDAHLFMKEDPDVQDIISALHSRFAEVEESDPSLDNYQSFVKELDKIIDWWEKLKANSRRRLAYHKENTQTPAEIEDNILMKNIGEINKNAKITPGSMRDVEKESNLFYLY